MNDNSFKNVLLRTDRNVCPTFFQVINDNIKLRFLQTTDQIVLSDLMIFE